MGAGDDDFTLVRKCIRDLRSSQYRAGQLKTQSPQFAYVTDALIDYKMALYRAAREMGRADELTPVTERDLEP